MTSLDVQTSACRTLCAAMLAQGVAESLSRSVRVNIEASVVLLRDEFPCRRVEDESPKPDGLLAALELQMDAGAEVLTCTGCRAGGSRLRGSMSLAYADGRTSEACCSRWARFSSRSSRGCLS